MENILSPQELITEVKNNFDIFNNCDLFDDSFSLSDLSEISIAHQFAHILKDCSFLSNYSIDIEYNQIAEKLFRPFLIVYLPKTQLANLLIIEFTKEGENINKGRSKMYDMTKRNGKNKYRLGMLVNFSKGYRIDDWKYFVNGQVMTKEGAIRALDGRSDRVKSLLSNQFQKIVDIYWTGKEKIDEDKHQIALAQSFSHGLTRNYLWDTAYNQLGVDYENMNIRLVQELYTFDKEIKKYLSHIWMPDYKRLSEVINFLYTDVLPTIKESSYSSNIYDIEWLNQWEDVLPAISKLLLYCHYSIIENNPQKLPLILSDLTDISKLFSNENILNQFENSFLCQ